MSENLSSTVTEAGDIGISSILSFYSILMSPAGIFS